MQHTRLKKEKNLDDLEFGNDFLDILQKAQSFKRIDKLDFIKIKFFYFGKHTRMKRQMTGREKIFAK